LPSSAIERGCAKARSLSIGTLGFSKELAMPMVPVNVDSSTVAITSVISAVITFGFCATMGLKPGVSLAIAAGVGILLYSFGVIPIGLLVVVGFAMIVAIFKKLFGGANPPRE